MTKKNMIIIMVIVGVVIIAAVMALLLVNEKVLTGNNQNQNGNVNQSNINNQQLPASVDIEGPAKPALNSTEQTVFFAARNFSERFSSFSSDAAGQNINELKSLTTTELFTELRAAAVTKSAGGFYSVASKALKVDILNSNDSEANIIVSLQRNEIKDDKPPFVFNQNLELKLIKSGDKWLVSEANWQ